MKSLKTFTDALIDEGVIHHVGGGRVKLTPLAARLVSALAMAMSREWDRTAYQISRSPNAREPRNFAQRKYAENASSALRSLVTRSVQKWKLDDLETGNVLAEEHHHETDFEFDPTAVVAKNKVKK